MTIVDDWVSFDTNIFIFGVREDPRLPECSELLERIGELQVYIPRQIIRELQDNLLPQEVSELFGLFKKYPDRIRIDWNLAATELIDKFTRLGCKLGDAAVAAHLEKEGVKNLVSENRHFLHEVSDLPFYVISAKKALEELSKK